MERFLQRFTPREQLSLLALAVAIGLYAAYQLLWSPLHTARDDLVSRNAATAMALQRVDAMVSEILELRSAGDGGGRPGNLVSLINRSTGEAGLAVSRLQPNSRGEVQVRLEGAAFDDLLGWLHGLESDAGVLVNEVSLSRAGAPGRVDATVRLARGG